MKLSEAHSEACIFGTTAEMNDPHIIAKFCVEGEPITKGRARYSGKTKSFYTPKTTTTAEAAIASAYLEQTGRLNGADDQGRFGVIAIFFTSTRQRRDVDNMLKLVMDGLTGVAWADDSQVTEVIGRKVPAFPTDSARTEVIIYPTNRNEIAGRTRNCPVCNKAYPAYPSQTNKIHCSQACMSESRRRLRVRTCEHCQKQFEAHGPEKQTRFCSMECRRTSTMVPVECARCGTAFMKPRHLNRSGNSYCSAECKATYWREQRKCAAEGMCKECGGPTTKKSYLRCQTCHFAAGGAIGSRMRKMQGLEP